MADIKMQDSGRQLKVKEGESLLSALTGEGFRLNSPCAGRGTCGKCKIRIISGGDTPLTAEERQLLRKEEIAGGIRLACMVPAQGSMTISLPGEEGSAKILEAGYVPDFERDSVREGYGIAADIGTTTVALSLVELSSGKECASISAVNEQRKYGADVLTRIGYERDHGEEGVKRLQEAIIDQLNEMIEKVCCDARISVKQIRKMIVAANCAMTHMLLGRDARPLGKAPFQPAFTNAVTVRAAEAGLSAGEEAELYCFPQVSGYIGGDIVAGVYACGMYEKKKQNILFIDIGTNGEMVLFGNGRKVCCSCAVGPALEGMNISCGMHASKGAVDEVRISDSGVCLSVIGACAPRGICGSGILAAVREMIRTEIVKTSGVFVKPREMREQDFRRPMIRMDGNKREFILSEDIVITQHDIRQIQLAKGAVRSGIEVLLRETGIKAEELDQIMVAGQFGAFLSEDSLVETGILPREARGKICYMGNTSKSGAYMALLSEKCRLEAEELTGDMEYVELAGTTDYERIFAESLKFPHSLKN